MNMPFFRKMNPEARLANDQKSSSGVREVPKKDLTTSPADADKTRVLDAKLVEDVQDAEREAYEASLRGTKIVSRQGLDEALNNDNVHGKVASEIFDAYAQDLKKRPSTEVFHDIAHPSEQASGTQILLRGEATIPNGQKDLATPFEKRQGMEILARSGPESNREEIEDLTEFAELVDEDAEHAEKVRRIIRKTDEIAAKRLTPTTAIPSRIDVPENPEDTKTGRKAAI